MGYQESVPDVPQLIPGTDFGLSDPVKNRALRTVFTSGTAEVLFDRPAYQVLHVNYPGSGKIGLIEKDGGWMAYYVHYEMVGALQGERAVTQVSIWRDPSSAYVAGITKTIFFDVLLKRFERIMSDGEQTTDGKRFWTTRLAEASEHGWKVGLLDLEKHLAKWRAPETKFRDWIASNDGWGSTETHQNLRYMISLN